MSQGIPKPISARELLAYRAEIRGDIFRQIHKRFSALKREGLTQKTVAQRLGMDEGQLSRILKGQNDLRLETLADLARALDCRIIAELSPLPPASAVWRGDIVELADPEAASGV